MLSFLLRRALLRPAIVSTAQILSTRPILSNRFLASSVLRSFATTSISRDAESTTSSEPASKPKSRRKSTRQKSASSRKASGKGKGKKPAKRPAKKAEKKITIGPQDMPPKGPSGLYMLWFDEWRRQQPKIDSLEAAQILAKKGSQTWSTLSDSEKQPYREKAASLRAEYKRRMDDWLKQVDPRILAELNRRRVAKGRRRIRRFIDRSRPPRPLSSFFRYLNHVREEHPRSEGDGKTYFTAVIAKASNGWRAMSDAEKAKYVDPARADLAAWREKCEAENQAKQ